MAIRMIALDLDGTTLNSSGHVSEHTREVLEKAIRNGVQVVVSTGRCYTSIPAEVLSIEGLNYTISSNGAIITDLREDQVFYSNCVEHAAVRKAIQLVDEYGLTLEAFWGGRAYIDRTIYDFIRNGGISNRNPEYVLSTRTPIEHIYKAMEENINRIENINICFPSTDRLEELKDIFIEIPDATITSSFRYNLEVGGPSTSKRNALETLIDRLGISREELMCCGDAPNDIEMIKFAGIGVAMGNAWGDTKEYADYVTATNDEDGVAKAVEKFVL